MDNNTVNQYGQQGSDRPVTAASDDAWETLMSQTWAASGMPVVAGLAMAALFGPAMAATASLNWSTFLRAGPGAQYTAIDELEHGASLSVGACAGQWCRVSDGAVIGYVDREALVLPAAPVGATAAVQTCFRSAQMSYKGPAPTRFCAAAGASQPRK